MTLDDLLSRFEKSKKTGPDKGIACCPAHPDRTPSLGVRDAGDKLLIHCRAGCSPHEVVSAVGLDLSDLFPEDMNYHRVKPVKKRFMPDDIFECLRGEMCFLLVCARDMQKGEALEERDIERLRIAESRILNSARAAGYEC